MGWERLLRERTCDLEAGLDGRASTALCWPLGILTSQVQLLYLDNSPLLGFLRDAPVFGKPGPTRRESRDQGTHTSFVFFFHSLQTLEILPKSHKAKHFFSLFANRWILSVPSHFETQSRPTQGFPSLWPTWTLWGHLRWQW